jgi:hypothetical protein
MRFICPVCGYNEFDEPPYDEYGYPSYNICSCCGFEFGFDDDSKKYTFEAYRQEWISIGYPYFGENKPKDWNSEKAKKQMENLKILNIKK